MTGWIEAAVLTLILCAVLFWLPRFGFPWTLSRDYKACFSSAPLHGRREGPCKAPWLDFSPDLVVLCCKQDIKDRGDGELMSLCASVCTSRGWGSVWVSGLSSASSVAGGHTPIEEEEVKPPTYIDDIHIHTHTHIHVWIQCTTEKDISVVYTVWAGWCLAILPPRA